MPALTSAAGVISLLDEPEQELKVYSLKKLNSLVDQFWAEIADSVGKIESLCEDDAFPQRDLASLVASKVYYHLGEYDDSVTFALGAGKLFDASDKTEYVDTIISKCIDKYMELRQKDETIDPRLTDIVERMFQRCYQDGEFKQAIGIALEARRLDEVEKAIKKGNQKELIDYVLDSSMNVMQNLEFRNKTLRLLTKLLQELPEPDYIAISQCLVHLNDPETCAKMMLELIKDTDDAHTLLAYQIAFDLEENARQDFLQKLVSLLQDGDSMDTTEGGDVVTNVRRILSGDTTIKLYLEFLFRNNKTDLLILKNTKNALDSRNSMYHSAITFANAFMNAGTTSDEFLRQNLEWLSRATNWSKFSATAALGVLHKGHLDQGMALLAPYLPKEGVSTSNYSEGGALFALGLIHANHGQGVMQYLSDALKNTQSEIIQHGACLGLGVAGMATAEDDIFEQLKTVLFSDSAIAGEAAGYAMGLIMLGTASKKALDEMLQYAHETQHEKIIRGLAVGMALIMYGKEEEADTLIEQLCTDKDPILRYGGIWTVALAYAGTGNNKAIRRLLHVAVSDVNDDVRRASVISLGFLLFRNPKQVPRIVQLLSESYNPHVRYGATLALGLACAGTGMPEAIELIEPMIKDHVDYVRQGAMIAMAMIFVQHNDVMSPKVATTRKLYETILGNKHEDALSKFGAVLGQGIIDAGGRNVTISLASRSGLVNRTAVVGAVLFAQYWYWFPMAHLLSLAFTPTAVVALNKDMKIPKLEFLSNAKPSLFAYPPQTKPPEPEKREKVATAVLSTTAKAKQRAKKSEKDKEDDAMEIETPVDKKEGEEGKEEKKEGEEEKKEEVEKKKKEPKFEMLQNMSRVLPQQLKYISFKDDSRYQPVKAITGGIVMVQDKKPGEAEEFIDFSTPQAPKAEGGDEAEAAPPEPFEYPFDD